MVKSGKFGLEVLVGGVPLAEMVTESGIVYVETRFDSPVTYKVTSKEKDPFGEVYEQQWPVTPYSLRISNRSGDKVHATVYIDGAVACKQFVDDAADIKGYRATYLVDDPYKEFTFTAPRRLHKHESSAGVATLTEAEKAELKKQLESIRVVIHEAKFCRSEQRECDGGASALTSSAEAVNKVLAKAAGVSTSSAAGKTLGGANALRGTTNFDIYDIGNVVMAEMTIRYTQRARLEEMGLLATSGSAPMAVPRSRAAAADAGGGQAAAKKPRGNVPATGGAAKGAVDLT